MGKPKQQVISRFFSAKPPPPPSNQNSPTPPPPPQPKASPKVTSTVSFSPSTTFSKRARPHSQNLTSSTKRSKPSLHEKLVSKLLDPPDSSSSLSSPKPLSKNPKYTPLEQQVLELKSQYPDVLLMVEVGYRYRFFGEDADAAARVLGIVAHPDHNFLTASVPTFRLNFYVRRLVGAGFKVGVVKQTETAAIKLHGSNRLGPFSRGLTALYTRSMLEAADGMGGGEEEGLVGSGGNYLLCVAEKCAVAEDKSSGVEGCFDMTIGIAAVEISTGEIIHGEFNDNMMRSGLEAVCLSISPAEILLGDSVSAPTEKLLLAYIGPASNVRVERASVNHLNDGSALAEVLSLYEEVGGYTPNVEDVDRKLDIRREGDYSSGIEGIMAMPELSVQALALSLRYLKKFGLERILYMGASFRPFSSNVEMTLSANTLHQLEVLRNNCDGSIEGSLLHSMDHTCTSFGSRLLKHWVAHPLCDRNSIIARLDAVAEIADSMGSCRGSQEVVLSEESSCRETSSVLSQVLNLLAKSPDVQRGITRIFHRTATPSEFIGALQTILFAGKQLHKLYAEDDGNDVMEGVKSALLRRLILTASPSPLTALAAQLLSSLNKDSANLGDMLNLFNVSGGQFPEVASGQIAVQIEKEKLDSLIIQYRKELGMRNLDFTIVSGVTHLIELSADAMVPCNWVKVNSTKKTVRYHPPEVLATLDKLALAKEECAVTCRKTWTNFLTAFGKYYAQFQAAVQALAALDCLHSLAILSRNQKYVRPTFVSNDEPGQIYISSGQHPTDIMDKSSGKVGGRTERSYMHWTSEMDITLSNALLEQHSLGHKTPNGWKSVAFTAAMTALKDICGVDTSKEKLMARLKTWNKYYIEVSAMLDTSGFGWDWQRNMVRVDSEEVWANYVKVLGSILGEHFVPNDTSLHADGEYCQVVTGPNMGGKSCYIRQVALIAIMSQVGSFVPACSAKLHVLDGIYTRMGASDSIRHGSSTFFEELGETSHILKHCTSRSLVIIDELGRGTSTHDGVAIAYATLHYLLHQKKCLILFVTHYPQILDIQNKFEGSVGAYHVSYLTMQKPLSLLESRSESDVECVDKQEVTFLYKVVHGASDKSFGLNVARLAQLPQSCIRRAAFLATKLETDACLQIENLVKLLVEKPQEQPKAYENPSDPPKIMHPEFKEMTEACRRVFYWIKSALHSAEGTERISCSLKEAQELARKVTKRSPGDFPLVEPQ